VTGYRSAPRSIGQPLGALTDDLSPRTLLADVQRAWAAVAGPAVAAEAQPVAERGGVVTVACSASVWAQELDLMGPRIVAGLNEALGSGRVQRLRCVAVGHER